MKAIRRTENAGAVLDRATLGRLRVVDLRGDLVPGWIGRFQDEAPRKLAEIEAALDAGDTAAAARLAHSLKSISGWLGGSRFSNLCDRVEKTARGGFAESCRRQLTAAQHALPMLLRELASYLGAAGSRGP